MSSTPRHLSRSIQTTLPVWTTSDDEEFDLRVTVRRWTKGERDAWIREYRHHGMPPSTRLLGRKPDECDRDPVTQQYLIPDAAIDARRLAEMSADERAAYDRMVDEETEAGNAFLIRTLSTYLTVEPGQLTYETETGETRPVATGEDFVKAFAGNGPVLQRALMLVHYENDMTPLQKKAWRSRLDFARTGRREPPGAAGSGPGPTAAAATPKGSASRATAPAGRRMTSSGAPVH